MKGKFYSKSPLPENSFFGQNAPKNFGGRAPPGPAGGACRWSDMGMGNRRQWRIHGGCGGGDRPPPVRSGENFITNQKLSQTIINHFLKGKNRSASGGFALRPPPLGGQAIIAVIKHFVCAKSRLQAMHAKLRNMGETVERWSRT